MKQRWSNLSLFNKMLLVLLLVSLLPLLIFGGILSAVSARNMETTAQKFASVLCAQAAAGVNDFVRQCDVLTKSILVDADTIQKLDDASLSVSERLELQLNLRRITQRVMTLNPDIQSILFLTEDGSSFQSEIDGSNIDIDTLKAQAWLQQALYGEDSFVVTPLHTRNYYDRKQDGSVLSVVRRMYSVQGYAGLLLIDMNSGALLSMDGIATDTPWQESIRVNVLNRQHGVLYDSSLLRGQVPTDEGSPTLDANQYNVTSAEVDQLGLTVNVIVPRNVMFRRISRLRVVIMVLILLLTGLTLWLSVRLSSRITRSIHALQSGMSDLEQEIYHPIRINSLYRDEIGALVDSYNHMVGKINTLINEVYAAEIRQREAQLLALQTQINPHMLFNTLESIRMRALTSGDEDVATMIKLLARMFRTVLDSGQRSTVGDEIEYVRCYVELQNLRMKNCFQLEIDVDPKWRDIAIPPIVFQPILENSIEHGYRGRLTPLKLSIAAEQPSPDRLCFILSDDGRGMSPERLDEMNRKLGRPNGATLQSDEGKRESIGLANIAERVRLFYHGDGEVAIESEEGVGTRVTIAIPLEETDGRSVHVYHFDRR